MGWRRRHARTVVDLRVPQVELMRYQCEGCGAGQARGGTGPAGARSSGRLSPGIASGTKLPQPDRTMLQCRSPSPSHSRFGSKWLGLTAATPVRLRRT